MKEFFCEQVWVFSLVFYCLVSWWFCFMMLDIFFIFYLEIEKDCLGMESCNDIFE